MAVRWYVAYNLSYRDIEELMAERGINVDHSTINRWVVQYNPYLLLKFNCHINVEICSSIKCVKYLYKYLFKGADHANIVISEKNNELGYDEIKWRIGNFA